jgi:prophage maintenance system killer protein
MKPHLPHADLRKQMQEVYETYTLLYLLANIHFACLLCGHTLTGTL